MKTKEEVIKQAWQFCGIPFGNYIDDNGFIEMSQNLPDIVDSLIIDVQYSNKRNNEFSFKQGKLRPKSLKGLENNNGWINIEDGLPKTDGWYHCISNDEEKMYIFNGINFVNVLGIVKNATHYQPIIKPLKPLY